MGVERYLEGIPEEGFLKISRPDRASLTTQQRMALNRRGNQFFNEGLLQQAKKIFIATGYGDGLIRIGDYYMQENEPLEALRMYMMASAKEKAERIFEDAASVVQTWLHDGTGKNEEITRTRDERT